jgi:hypothetical protein
MTGTAALRRTRSATLLPGDSDDLGRCLPDRHQGAKAVRLWWQQGGELPLSLLAQVTVDDLLWHLRDEEGSLWIDTAGQIEIFWLPIHSVPMQRLPLHHMEEEQLPSDGLGVLQCALERLQRACRKIGRNKNALHHVPSILSAAPA